MHPRICSPCNWRLHLRCKEDGSSSPSCRIIQGIWSFRVELDGACVRGLSRGALIDRAGIENINIEELFAVTISSLGKISLLFVKDRLTDNLDIRSCHKFDNVSPYVFICSSSHRSRAKDRWRGSRRDRGRLRWDQSVSFSFSFIYIRDTSLPISKITAKIVLERRYESR